MKFLKIGLSVVVVLVVALAFLAPIGPLPGLLIGGKETPVPDSWGDTSQLHEIKLKVPGTIPRVVTIWVVQFQSDLYVVGNSTSGWVKLLGAGGPVSMRIDDKTFGLKASQVMAGWQPIMLKYVDKYRADYPDIINGFPSLEDAEGKIAVFKLS